jgi:aspartate/methionine/tyrosine aminotransferase
MREIRKMKIKDFKLEEYFAQHEFNVKYLLCSSDCESYAIGDLLTLERGAEKKFKDHWCGYTESHGSPELRREISNLYSNINEENVIVFAGAEEGIFILMNVLLNKDDHIIVQHPAYQSLYEIANSIGCEVTKWQLQDSDEWELSLDFLSTIIRANTKLIVINFPHNPTGYLPDKNFYNGLLKIAQENDIQVFSDEVYRFLEYDAHDRLPAAVDVYEKALSLGVMSKSFGLAGLRIGWIACSDERLMQSLASFKNYTTICNSAPSEFLATLALRNKEKILARNLTIIKSNLQLLDPFFEENNRLLSWHKPKAGSIAFPKLLTSEKIENFCSDLLRREGVLLMPGTMYEFGDSYFRIGFGRKNMPEALMKFENFLKNKVKS